MSDQLFQAILAMDAYNRGLAPGLSIPDSSTQIDLRPASSSIFG